MKSAARVTLKILAILGLIGSLIYGVVWAILFSGILSGDLELTITFLLPMITSIVLFLLNALTLIALKVDTKGFMVGVGVLGCLFVVGLANSIILFCIAHYEFDYYYED